jgi:hypothetical protein
MSHPWKLSPSDLWPPAYVHAVDISSQRVQRTADNGHIFASNPIQAFAANQQDGELLTAPFTSGPWGATTEYEYSGTVTLTVSGFGQASATAQSSI